jgi:hypothetical protein
LSERTNPDEDGLAAGERFRTTAFHLTLLALFISQASPLVVRAQDRPPVTLSGAEIQVEARSRLSAPGPQERRFAAYIEGLATPAGHQDRQAPLKNYCKGLLLPGEQVRNYVLPAMQKQEPWWPGSWMTLGFRRRASIRSASLGNLAVKSVSKKTADSR